jgi:M6 family metalloprotease-like protein
MTEIGFCEIDFGVQGWASVPGWPDHILETCGDMGHNWQYIFWHGGVGHAIVLPPSVHVLTPNGGESWTIGEKYAITWEYGDVGDTFDISIISSGGTASYVINNVAGIGGTGSVEWTVPEDASIDEYKVYVSSGGVSDESDYYFNIVGKPQADLEIISPAGGEKWCVGNEYDISGLNSAEITAVVVQIMNGSFTQTLTPNLQTSGTFTFKWHVPNDFSPGKYQVKTTSSDGKHTDVSSDITIVAMKVLTPNGGEDYDVKKGKIPVTWQSDGSGDNMWIVLFKEGSDLFTAAVQVPDTGQYTWDMQNYQIPRGKYVIGIGETVTDIIDKSDDHFNLTLVVSSAIIPAGYYGKAIAFDLDYYSGIANKLSQYLNENSYGRLNIGLQVVQKSDNTGFYSSNRAFQMYKDAPALFSSAILERADNDFVNFTNGGVVICISSNNLESDPNTYGEYFIDQVMVDQDTHAVSMIYSYEERFQSSNKIIRTLAHELAHYLGANDEYSIGNIDQYLSLMAGSDSKNLLIDRVHMDSFTKLQLGWLNSDLIYPNKLTKNTVQPIWKLVPDGKNPDGTVIYDWYLVNLDEVMKGTLFDTFTVNSLPLLDYGSKVYEYPCWNVDPATTIKSYYIFEARSNSPRLQPHSRSTYTRSTHSRMAGSQSTSWEA